MARYLFPLILLFSFSLASGQTPTGPPTIKSLPFTQKVKAPKTPTILKAGEFDLKSLFDSKTKPELITWDLDTEEGTMPPLKIKPMAPKSVAFGYRPGEEEPDEYEIPDLPTVALYAIRTGSAKLSAWEPGPNGKPKKIVTILIQTVGPSPVPIPPPPTPIPVPPPTPPPIPVPVNPIPSDKLRVLMIYENKDKITPQQNSVLKNVPSLHYINTTGGEWRVWDQNTNVEGSDSEQWWKDAWKRPRKQLPWIIISSPFGFTEEPLPATPDDLMNLAKKYNTRS